MLHNLSRLCTFRRLVHNRYCVTTGAPGQTPGFMYRVYNCERGIFEMDSYLEDEFGNVLVRCIGDLTSVESDDRIILTCPGSVPVSVRIREMQHFLRLLALFDPLLGDSHEKDVSQTPSEPWT